MLRERLKVLPFVAIGGASLVLGAYAIAKDQRELQIHAIEVPTVIERATPAPSEVAPGVPGRMMACADEPELRVLIDNPLVCSKATGNCFAFSQTGPEVFPVADAPSVQGSWWLPSPATPELGPKLRARLDADEDVGFVLTTDRRAAVVGDTELWSIEHDRVIHPTPPRSTTADPVVLTQLVVAGNAIHADWASCAGPCARRQILDSRGHAFGEELDGYGSITQLDDDHYFYLGEWGRAAVLDMSGKILATRDLGADAGGARVARLTDHEVALLELGDGRDEVALLTGVAIEGTTIEPSTRTRAIPPCKVRN